MSIIEHRQGIELRADGRTLVGAAVRYGDVSPSHRERFEPGSLTVSPDLAPCLGHRTGRVLAYGQDVTVEDRADALIVSAHLPRTATADLALAGVQSGRYRGWSVEFQARRETRDAEGIRVVQAADLPGLALVDHPSYPGSGVEARARRSWSSYVARERIYGCKCAGQLGRKSAGEISFGPDSFEKVLREVATGDRLVTAIGRGASDVIATTARGGGLKLTNTKAGLGIGVTALDTEAGRRFDELARAGVPVFARPIIDADSSTFTFEGDRAIVTDASFYHILLKPVADPRGLDAMTRGDVPEGRARVPEPAPSPVSAILRAPVRLFL